MTAFLERFVPKLRGYLIWAAVLLELLWVILIEDFTMMADEVHRS